MSLQKKKSCGGKVYLERELKRVWITWSFVWLASSLGHKNGGEINLQKTCNKEDVWSHPSRLTNGLLGLLTVFTKNNYLAPVRHVEPGACISLNRQWLRITVSSRRMEHSDFTWVLAMQMNAHLTIYCALMPICRAWLSLHPLFSAYPLL